MVIVILMKGQASELIHILLYLVICCCHQLIEGTILHRVFREENHLLRNMEYITLTYILEGQEIQNEKQIT